MAAVIELEDPEWKLIEGLVDRAIRPGPKAKYPRRDIVDAILFIARTGIQWRYLPAKYRPDQLPGSNGVAGETTASGIGR
jgi:transposase